MAGVESTFGGFPPHGITDCPMCGYDLTGLPAAHRCPECGFEYDEATYVLRATLRHHRRQIKFLLPINILMLFLFVAKFLTGTWRPSVWEIGPIIWIFAAIIMILAWNRPSMIVVAPVGVIFRVFMKRRQSWRWEEITRVLAFGTGKSAFVELYLAGGKTKSIRGIFQSDDEAREIELAVAARLAARSLRC